MQVEEEARGWASKALPEGRKKCLRSPPPCDDGTHETADFLPPSGGVEGTDFYNEWRLDNIKYHARAPRRRAHEERSDEKPQAAERRASPTEEGV